MSISAESATFRRILEESKGITVPWYQRSYKWERKQIEEVFNDVLLFFGQNEGQSAFLGSIVFCPGSSGDDEIVDGQQRVTTLCIMAAVVASRILESDPESSFANDLFILLWRKNGEKPKLIHKNEDLFIFREIVSRQPGGVLDFIINPHMHPINRVLDAQSFLKDKNIFSAYGIVKEMIDDTVSSACETRGLSPQVALTQLLKVLLDQVNLVRIKADTHMDGVRIFEALNATGMPLEIYELVKSSFYMQASTLSEVTRDKVMDTWEQDQSSVYSLMKSDTDKNQFLRTYWMSRFGMVAKNRLFDCYAEHVANVVKKGGENGLVNECSMLVAGAQAYDMMVNEVGQFSCLSVQNNFGAVIYRAPLLALWLNSGLSGTIRVEAFKRLSMVLESVLVRMSICGQTTNSIDKAFATIASKISKMEMGSTPTEIESNVSSYLNESSHQVPSDAIFHRCLLDTSFKKKPTRWRSLFMRIDHALRCPTESAFKYDPSITTVELDFMVPPFEEPSRGQLQAAGFTNVQEYLKGMSLIGNFVLIDKNSGRIKNCPVNSGILTTSQNCKDNILTRTSRLANIAVQIWKI